MALYTMMFMGMGPIGSLLSGSVAHVIGAPLAVGIGGGLGLLGTGLIAWRLPHLRVEARQLIVAQGMAGGEPADQMPARTIS